MRKAVVVGFEYPSRYLVRLMGRYARNWRCETFPQTRFGLMRTLWSLRTADALISFGGPGPNAALALAAHQHRVPLVVIWAGTDVLEAASNPYALEVSKRDTSADLAVAPWLADELRGIGVPATFQPVISAPAPPEPAPFPDRFTVLCYLPAPRRRFYGEDRMYAIAHAIPRARFLVVGSGGRNPKAPPNVEFLGQVTHSDPVIDASCVLLRMPEHDGQSMMVLEAMGRGRHVIWNYAVPGVRLARTGDEALMTLYELLDLHDRRRLGMNEAGYSYVKEHCAPQRVAADFEACLDRLIPVRVTARNGHRKRVAISGYGLFCAEVAHNIERLHPEWEAQILRPSSRVEALSALLQLSRSKVWYTIGSPMESRLLHHGARLLGIHRVMHWVGSDIERARTDPAFLRAVQTSKAKHLTEIDWTARELRDIGLESQISPLPIRHQGNGVKPLPDRFTILLYLPTSRADFYGLHECRRLLQELRDRNVNVLVVGGGTLDAPPGVTVDNRGWKSDLRSIYEQSTVLIRFTPHDGLALMVVEALSFGRHVIWSRPFPYCANAATYRDLLAATTDLLERHERGELHAQYAAAEMVRERYSTQRCIEDIVATFETRPPIAAAAMSQA